MSRYACLFVIFAIDIYCVNLYYVLACMYSCLYSCKQASNIKGWKKICLLHALNSSFSTTGWSFTWWHYEVGLYVVIGLPRKKRDRLRLCPLGIASDSVTRTRTKITPPPQRRERRYTLQRRALAWIERSKLQWGEPASVLSTRGA